MARAPISLGGCEENLHKPSFLQAARCNNMSGNLAPLLLFVFLPWLLLQLLSDPSCTEPTFKERRKDTVQLVAMVVGDLHLAGPRTIWIDRVRRDSFMKTSFRRAYQMLKPDALLVLGDVSDWGRKSTNQQWESVIQRFRDMVSPYSGLPIHVAVGNHDVGDFYQITPGLLQQFRNSFPELDETGSDTFTVKNITFVSLNAMALACDSCPLQFSMQRVVEKVKARLQKGFAEGKSADRFSNGLAEIASEQSDWSFSRGNSLEGPVLLLHLPLYRVDESVCNSIDTPRCAPWHEVEGGCLQFGASSQSAQLPLLKPYRIMMDMLSLNTSRYLLSALRPRLVLTAHTHRFCNRVHDGGTREITVSTFTWRNRDDPSFLLTTFYKDGAIEVQQCFLPCESLVLGLHVLQGTLLILGIVTGGILYWKGRKRVHLKT